MMKDNKIVDELAEKIAQAVKTGIKEEIISEDEISDHDQNIIELDDEDIGSDLDGLILDPTELERDDEPSSKGDVGSTVKIDPSTIIQDDDDQEIEYIEYVQKTRTNTLTRNSLIYELTDLTLITKKFHKRSVVENNPDLSITLASDKGLTRDFIDDVILKLTS